MDASPHVFDATLAGFEQDVILASKEQPVLVDFWATWCGPCKTLGPILEKLAADYQGAFRLAKVDVDQEQQLAGYFQIKSIPTVMLLKDGQIVDGFPGALPEGQLREFLQHHGITPRAAADAEAVDATAAPLPPADPETEVRRIEAEMLAAPDNAALKLDLALALLAAGRPDGVESQLLDTLPADLGTDPRAVRARAHLGFLLLREGAPASDALEAAITADPADLRSRHLLGVRLLLAGDAEGALREFLEILKRDRHWQDGAARKALIDAFRVIDDEDLVGRYRRKMASLLF